MLLKNVPMQHLMAIGSIQNEACCTAKILGALIAQKPAIGVTSGQRIGLK